MGRSLSPSHRRREKNRSERKRKREHRSGERERNRDTKRMRSRSSSRILKRRRSQDHHDRHRDRSRSRKRHNNERRSRCRSRSPSHDYTSRSTEKYSHRRDGKERPEIIDIDLEENSSEEDKMLKLMGFSAFDTTKNRKVEGNDVGEVHVVMKRKYRQYMNRKGGFNRLLDSVD